MLSSFQGLGSPNGLDSYGTDVSGDGTTVVGAYEPGNQAYRWTEQTGIVAIAGGRSHTHGVSADGSIVVGSDFDTSANPNTFRPFKSTDGQPIAYLDSSGTAFDVAETGAIIGTRNDREAFVWTDIEQGYLLPNLDGVFESQGVAISANGSVAVGWSTSGRGTEATRWSDQVPLSLGDFAGGSFFSRAFDVSADGSTIVGESESAAGVEAFRWDEADGIAHLGDLPGGNVRSVANGVSGDGSVIVGWSESALGKEAFIWDQTHGMRKLADVLLTQGQDVAADGYHIIEAFGVSDDGRTIVGNAINAAGHIEAFMAKVEQDFQGLGSPFGLDSGASDVSADGSTAVGAFGHGTGDQAYRWNAASGMVSVAGPYSAAHGVSADGSVVVGGDSSLPGGVPQPFLWTEGGGMVHIGPNGVAFNTSADGSIIVGEQNGNEAFIWTEPTGIVGLGDLPGGEFNSQGIAISADGSVVAGWGASDAGTEAMRWTAGAGMVGLGDLPGGGFFSRGFDVSPDGSTVVGEAESQFGIEACRWTSGGGAEGLGDFPGGEYHSVANGVSANGSIVVGWSVSSLGKEAFVWDVSHGMRRLVDVLLGQGVNVALGGWQLIEAFGVSDDGRTIVGNAINAAGHIEGFMANVVPQEDGDTDGVGDDLEDVVGDGNDDGIPDRNQANVASFIASNTVGNTQYLTMVSAAGTALADVQSISNPSAGDSPAAVDFPVGFLDFKVTGVNDSTAVSLYLPAGSDLNSFWKFGPTPDNVEPHWYDFAFDPVTNTGAVINGNIVTLHFVDGLRGDDDLLENGVIDDAGAPAFSHRPAAASQSISVLEDGQAILTLSGSDIDTAESALTFTIASVPVDGILMRHDGTPVVVGATFIGPPTLTYAPGVARDGAGTDSFTFIATDAQGLVSSPATVTITINQAVQDGAVTIDAGGIVRIGGSSGNDSIVLTSRSGVLYRNGVSTGVSVAAIHEIRVWGRAGSDRIELVDLAIASLLHGGAGDDVLTGGAGDDLIFGSTGDDVITGAAGNDMLIGGQGADRIVGSAGHDILVGGDIASKFTHEALKNIARRWASNKVADAGSDDDTLDETVVDSAIDKLTGSSGSDWFIVDSADKITDFKGKNGDGDVVTYV